MSTILEPYIEYLNFHVAHPEFSWLVLVTSFVVALGGLAVGWLVYGRGLPTKARSTRCAAGWGQSGG